MQVHGDILELPLPDVETVSREEILEFRKAAADLINSGDVKRVSFQLAEGNNWNSLTLAILRKLVTQAHKAGIDTDFANLPEGAVKILSLSKDPITSTDRDEKGSKFQPFFAMGAMTISFFAGAASLGRFIAEATASLFRAIGGKASFQGSDFKGFVKAAGPDAFMIVGVVNLLLGVILAFMGAVQLQLFGAEIFVANLVALGHTREIAPMMTAIVLAGRTGAAYAAQLGTMQVNEEIDALTTFGFTPMDFLVLPRMLALALMTPLLVLYGDAIGMFGGYLIGITMLDIGSLEYLNQTQNAISLGDIGLGIFKGSVFGVLVAITGCREGMASGRSASAVGDAATRAVVNGILAIIIATAVFAVVTNWLGI
ncbi:MAG: ABC transporter permease [Hyphomonadaceae bacterium]